MPMQPERYTSIGRQGLGHSAIARDPTGASGELTRLIKADRQLMRREVRSLHAAESPIDGVVGIARSRRKIISPSDTNGLVVSTPAASDFADIYAAETSLPQIEQQQPKPRRRSVLATASIYDLPIKATRPLQHRDPAETSAIHLKANFPKSRTGSGRATRHARLLVDTSDNGLPSVSVRRPQGPNVAYVYVVDPNKRANRPSRSHRQWRPGSDSIPASSPTSRVVFDGHTTASRAFR